MTELWRTGFVAGMGAPGDVLPVFPQGRGFGAGETVRQWVRLRRGGGRVRVEVSNEFGTRELVVGGVSVAGLDALLDGEKEWRIGPGERAVGDPVEVTVAAGDELAVELRFAAETEEATFLHSAQRTSEVLPGGETSPSLFYLSRVLTDGGADARPVVVAFGDSITRGDGSSVDSDRRYPDYLQERLGDGAVVLNAGIGGNRVLKGTVGPAMVERFERDVLAVDDATHVIIMGGPNDLGLPSVLGGERPTARELFDGLMGLAARAERHGIRALLGTITPMSGSLIPAFVALGNAEVRAEVNELIRAQTAYAVVDFAAALGDAAEPDRLRAEYDSGDGAHPGDAGCEAMANAVDLALLQ